MAQHSGPGQDVVVAMSLAVLPVLARLLRQAAAGGEVTLAQS